MTRSFKEPCGCRADDQKWLEMCPAHLAEFTETHERWAADHAARSAGAGSVVAANAGATAELALGVGA
jgi:hypothetical protein